MSKDKCDTQGDCIETDKEALREELLPLTRAQRVIIIEEYKARAQEFGVGMKEFSIFMKLFDELES